MIRFEKLCNDLFQVVFIEGDLATFGRCSEERIRELYTELGVMLQSIDHDREVLTK